MITCARRVSSSEVTTRSWAWAAADRDNSNQAQPMQMPRPVKNEAITKPFFQDGRQDGRLLPWSSRRNSGKAAGVLQRLMVGVLSGPVSNKFSAAPRKVKFATLAGFEQIKRDRRR